jgi:hypothetical protein
MAKQDVLDAINATIAPNNIKGITAESLNNVLTMMTENAGEGGSGNGALRVIVPDMMLLGPEVLSMGELSPVSWEEMKSLLEQVGVDPSEYDAAVKASFEHNANVAQQIIEKGKAGQGVSVVLDQTPYFPASINTSLQMNPEMAEVVEELAMYAVQPAALFMQYMNATPEGEAMVGGDVFDCVLAPTGNTDIDGMSTAYLSNVLIFLNLDGSLLFEVIEEEQPSSGSGVVTFYTTVSGEITEEQKEKNVEAFSKYAAGIPVSVIVNNESLDSTYHPFTTAFYAESDYVLCGFPIKKSDDSFASMRFNKDGSVVMQME